MPFQIYNKNSKHNNIPSIMLFFMLFFMLLPACSGSDHSAPVDAHAADTCQQQKKKITKAALAEASCSKDADCSIRELALCSIKGIGCFYHVTNISNSRQPLDEAIQKYINTPCIMAKCDCAADPVAFHCQNNRCVAKDKNSGQDSSQGVQMNKEEAMKIASKKIVEQLKWKLGNYKTEAKETETAWEISFTHKAPMPPGAEATVIINKGTGKIILHQGE